MLQKYIHLRHDHRRQDLCADTQRGLKQDYSATSIQHLLSPFCLFLSLSLFLAVARQQAATNESKRACDTGGSVAGIF